MKLLAHRGVWTTPSEQNTFDAFAAAFRAGVGIETDVRSFRGELYLSHDPIQSEEEAPRLIDLFRLASDYAHLPLFLNIKEDGLAPLLLNFKREIERLNVVFFDMSLPELVRYAKHFPSSQLSTRVSDLEPTPYGLHLCDWIWVDGFERDLFPLEIEKLSQLGNKRLAFVSPELHGRSKEEFWQFLKTVEWLPRERCHLCTDCIDEAQQ